MGCHIHHLVSAYITKRDIALLHPTLYDHLELSIGSDNSKIPIDNTLYNDFTKKWQLET